MKKLHGFSIVEIMVALVISTILLGGVVTVFNMSKRTYTLQSELSDLQSNARFVMNELIDELRVVGYTGCKDVIDNVNPFLDNTIPFGINVSVNDDDISNTATDAYPPSDRLVFNIDKAVQQELILTPNDDTQFEAITNNINLTASSNALINNSRVGIRDCSGIDYYNALQDVNDITIQPIPIRIYQTPLDLFMTGGTGSMTDIDFSTVMYEVRADDDTDRLGLYKNITHGNVVDQELFVEGVENMQIRYGIDNDGDGIPNIYNNIPPPQGVISSPPVVSIRLTILMRTAKKRGITCPFDKEFFLDVDLNCSGKPCEDGSYRPLEDNIEYEEGYCHRLFTTTIGVRNGIFPY